MTLGRESTTIVMPNDVRAAGHHIFYKSLIESRWNLDLHWFETDKKEHRLENKEFVTVSEIESVMYPVALLIKQVQTDMFGSLSYSFLLIFRTYHVYCVQKKWWIANVD